MGKTKPIEAYFKRKFDEKKEIESSLPFSEVDTPIASLPSIIDTPIPSSSNTVNHPTKIQRVENKKLITEVDLNSLNRDPGERERIWDYHVDLDDEVRRAYIKNGPYQPILVEYPKSKKAHKRRFQRSWFNLFPLWLEYSPTKDASFCLPCYLFSQPSENSGNNAFIVDGFQSWRKVRDGKNCAFLNHEGSDPNSCHKICVKKCEDLINQSQHIQRVIENFTDEQITNNRLRVKCSIQAARWLSTHAIALRGHDESHDSFNRGNFLDILSLMGELNEKIGEVVLDKAPKNASYTSPKIQKEILHVIAVKVKKAIRDEIGEAKYSILVDEARDESKREQMSIVLRFVDSNGFVRERFFGLVHVANTAALTLKNEIYSILSNHSLDIKNIRGQGYDGASNMRGEWNGLQALVSHDCQYAYYVHCLAHRLQLALVAASKDVLPIFHFFSKLNSIINIVGASCKRTDELRAAKVAEIEYLLSIDELETGRGLNQIGTLQRASDTRWSSHLRSVLSLINMFSPTCEVLLNIIDDGATVNDRGTADAAYESLTSFEFIFILHVMKEIMGITDFLCQTLQSKSQDIVNAIHLVSSTKTLIQKLRDDGWNTLLETVKSFCGVRNIDIPDFSTCYIARGGRARHQQDEFTMEHHYHIDIFNAAIDSQLQELNNRFSENAIELLTLSSALDPREGLESFRTDDVWKLMEKYYPEDFEDDEKIQLKMQLPHYKHNVVGDPEFKKLSNISELCQWLVKTRKSITYHLVYQLIVLVLTLPVSTATTERSFSAMKIIKTRLRNKMEDDYLSDTAVLYIEREIALKFSLESIIDDFRDLKERRAPL